ncbi:MCE family protein [Streptomyces sp. DSM 44917]|uniref:MCE family protein n=1 Tax=Streptomyces boetiae TaxID=3075541 RepID=A0ABU2L8Y0_9ACTN|nr:MCE family protein [Streptomyces sp. DSM 44917]MDT0307950.1 MCE family protein [Streptomyces sp. DSM 44917]
MTTTAKRPAAQPPAGTPAGPPPVRKQSKVRQRLAGVLFLAIPILLVWLSIAIYNNTFTESVTVVVETGTAGNEMRPTADVKMRGVIIGEVREVEANGEGARLTLALQPDEVDRIPADVAAQLLPTTLFGERYVALVPPGDSTAGERLAEGDVITEDRSSNAVEVNETLDNMLPMLNALQPQRLSAILTAMSQALDGRGTDLGETIVRLDQQLEEINPTLPALNEDISRLVEVTNLYADVDPDLLDALEDFTTTSATVADLRDNLGTLYASVTTVSRDLDAFLTQNQSNIIRLAETSRPTMELIARYSPAFPCTFRTLADFVPVMDRALGAGTDEPGVHINVQVVQPRGSYGPGDTPGYGGGGGPQCYGVPYGGSGGNSPASYTGGEGLGLPNSAQENALVRELLAADGSTGTGDLPEWSSLLAGPAFRGAEVELR